MIERAPSPAALIQANFNAIARILGARLALLLSLIGTFVLALQAMAWQSAIGLGVVIAFALLTLVPLLWAEFMGRRR